MSETKRDYSKPVSEEQENFANAMFVASRHGINGDPEAGEFRRMEMRRLVAEFVARLGAPAAPGIREAAEELGRYVGRVAGRAEGWAVDFERILLSRLGASGKAGWTKEKPTKPGWYLHRTDGVPILMDVYVDPNLPDRVSVRWAEHSGGWGMSVDLDSIHVGEWSGPIPVPDSCDNTRVRE